MTADDRITVRLPGGLRERMRQARGDLAESEFVVTAITALIEDSGPGGESFHPVPSGAAGTFAPGEPSPGVVCSGPGCWERSTSRYGLRGLPLCPACAAAACGQTYTRPRASLPLARKPARSAP